MAAPAKAAPAIATAATSEASDALAAQLAKSFTKRLDRSLVPETYTAPSKAHGGGGWKGAADGAATADPESDAVLLHDSDGQLISRLEAGADEAFADGAEERPGLCGDRTLRACAEGVVC